MNTISHGRPVDNDDAEMDREARDYRRQIKAEIRAEYTDEEWARLCEEETAKANEFDAYEPEPISDEEKDEFWENEMRQHETE